MSSPAWHSCRAAVHPKAVLKLNLLPDPFIESFLFGVVGVLRTQGREGLI